MPPSEGSASDLLIVDDEMLARRHLRGALEELPGPKRIREAATGPAALASMAERMPDVVFLDVQMPEMDGFGVIEAIGADRMPAVIFVTAYHEHAVRAFEVHALDYLLKPVDPDRLRDALSRYRGTAATSELAEFRTALRNATRAIRGTGNVASPTPTDDRIAIRESRRTYFLRRDEILRLESAGNYIEVHARGQTLRHRATLEEFAAELGTGFIRLRRSTLVRRGAIRMCEPYGKGSFVVTLDDGTRIISSRYYRRELGDLLG